MKMIFCLQINIKGFFKFILSFQVCVARHAQITENMKFAISFQDLKKEVSDEVDFCVYISMSLLHIDTMILIGMIQYCQSTQSNKFALSLQYLKKEIRNGVYFLLADKYQSFYKLALSFLMEVVRHNQSTQNRKLLIFCQYIKKQLL